MENVAGNAWFLMKYRVVGLGDEGAYHVETHPSRKAVIQKHQGKIGCLWGDAADACKLFGQRKALLPASTVESLGCNPPSLLLGFGLHVRMRD